MGAHARNNMGHKQSQQKKKKKGWECLIEENRTGQCCTVEHKKNLLLIGITQIIYLNCLPSLIT